MCDRSLSLMSLQTCVIWFITIFMDCIFYTMIGESDNMSALTPHSFLLNGKWLHERSAENLFVYIDWVKIYDYD